MSEIVKGHLHIGNWQEAQTQARDHYVITVAIDSPFVGDEHFKLVDGPGNDPNLFAEAVRATVKAVQNQPKPVLVHCVSGRSRSAAVIVAALTKLNNRNLCEAYDLMIVKYDRTRIHPHLSKLLLSYE